MSHITPEKEPYGKASFLVIFIILWVVIFTLTYYGSSAVHYGPYGEYRLLEGPVIFSTLIAALIACLCYTAGGGIRNPKELAGGITWDHT
jgi:succinate dehydrogenase/fumarate reductase cytochrome b subunit